MELTELQKFCDTNTDHEAYGITEPFSRGEWTYATNGHICVRIPRISAITHEAKTSVSESAEKLFTDTKARTTVWQSLPVFELKRSDCSTCGGTGYIQICPAYDHPDHKCFNGESKICQQYNADCAKGCSKDAELSFKCGDCDGSGEIKLPGKYIVQGSKGTTQISAIYLDMIKDLPDVMIAPYDETSAFLFRFDGGEGMLMPMKQEAHK